jgi:hypothetical protein
LQDVNWEFFFLVQFMGCYEYTNPNDEAFWHHDLQCQDSHHCAGEDKSNLKNLSSLCLWTPFCSMDMDHWAASSFLEVCNQSFCTSHMIRRTVGRLQKWRNQNLHWLQNYITHCWCWC